MSVGADFARLQRAVEEMGVPSIGPEEGRFLYLVARISGARRVLELGTGVGYSTAWLAIAVGPRGSVTTIEIDASRASTAQRLLSEMGLSWVKVMVGNALDLLKHIEGDFDLIFVDILRSLNREEGEMLGRLLVEKVVPGGLLIADNARAPLQGAEAFVNYVAGCPSFEHVIVPYREGVLLALRGGT